MVEPETVVARIREALSSPDLDPEDPQLAQELLAAAIKLLGFHADEGRFQSPYPPDAGISASEVAITASLILQEAEVEIFELAMWQTWAGQTRVPSSPPASSNTDPKGVDSVG